MFLVSVKILLTTELIEFESLKENEVAGFFVFSQ